MNLIYYPNKFLDKQVKVFDIENPPVDPKELKDKIVELMSDSSFGGKWGYLRALFKHFSFHRF